MPELPEVETVARGLSRAMAGRIIEQVTLNRPDLRFPFPQGFAQRLAGAKIARMRRRAKYLLADLEPGGILLMHLGMSGRFDIKAAGPAKASVPADRQGATGAPHDPHRHVVFHMDDGSEIAYRDPRRFGFMDLADSEHEADHPRLRGLGVEPLGNALNESYLSNAFRGKQTSLKAVLLDQRIIAGLGNIYVCEALFRAGLSPRLKAGAVARNSTRARKAMAGLVTAIRDVLNEAIAAGGSSLRDYAGADGTLGTFQHGFEVYDRTGKRCLRPGCPGIIKRIVQNNRSSFFCPKCQH